jgi:hypothetical protein
LPHQNHERPFTWRVVVFPVAAEAAPAALLAVQVLADGLQHLERVGRGGQAASHLRRQRAGGARSAQGRGAGVQGEGAPVQVARCGHHARTLSAAWAQSQPHNHALTHTQAPHHPATPADSAIRASVHLPNHAAAKHARLGPC